MRNDITVFTNRTTVEIEEFLKEIFEDFINPFIIIFNSPIDRKTKNQKSDLRKRMVTQKGKGVIVCTG